MFGVNVVTGIRRMVGEEDAAGVGPGDGDIHRVIGVRQFSIINVGLQSTDTGLIVGADVVEAGHRPGRVVVGRAELEHVGGRNAGKRAGHITRAHPPVPLGGAAAEQVGDAEIHVGRHPIGIIGVTHVDAIEDRTILATVEVGVGTQLEQVPGDFFLGIRTHRPFERARARLDHGSVGGRNQCRRQRRLVGGNTVGIEVDVEIAVNVTVAYILIPGVEGKIAGIDTVGIQGKRVQGVAAVIVGGRITVVGVDLGVLEGRHGETRGHIAGK